MFFPPIYFIKEYISGKKALINIDNPKKSIKTWTKRNSKKFCVQGVNWTSKKFGVFGIGNFLRSCRPSSLDGEENFEF